MKPDDETRKSIEEWTGHKTLIVEQWWVGLAVLVFWAAVIVGVFLLTSCGGTFSISPSGVVSYTTPEILKAPIVREK